jgi:hypothetical protein
MHIQATRDVFFVIFGPFSPDHTVNMQMPWRLKKGHQNTGAGHDPTANENNADSSENISCIFFRK